MYWTVQSHASIALFSSLGIACGLTERVIQLVASDQFVKVSRICF